MKISKNFLFLLLLASVNLNACASVKNRHDIANKIIENSGLSTKIIQSKPFKIFSSHNTNNAQNNEIITVVIEGDGYSWINRHTISDDPTPKNPVGLKIASALPEPVIYLARPCQYITSNKCNKSVWTSHRFSKNIISSYMNALNQLKNLYNNKEFHIIGFSGGAFIALTLSSKRNDISKVSTVSGVLDPNQWTDAHNISTLFLDDDMIDILQRSKQTTFHHMCSTADTVTPCSLSTDFINHGRKLGLQNHNIYQYEQAGHHSLWKEAISNITQ